MKDNLSDIENYRIKHPNLPDTRNGDLHGFFIIPFEGRQLSVMSSGSFDKDFEHVSVSLKNRCPNWKEMSFIKDCFFKDDEVVMQLHPAKKDYVNNHNYCLHLWRPLKEKIPMPPSIAVGIKNMGVLHE